MGCATQQQPAVKDPLLGASVQQAVTVQTPGCSVVSCELLNDKGTWTVPSTPGTVTLTTSRQPLNVSCRADSGVLASVASPPTRPAPSGKGAVTGGAVGGAAIGVAAGSALSVIPVLGAIAVLTSIAVGAASGQVVEAAQQPLLYPDRIVLAMDCAPASGN
jgi:predicted lipid-binding transport protein (Tim44 family)